MPEDLLVKNKSMKIIKKFTAQGFYPKYRKKLKEISLASPRSED
jgi:hypothetical protein